MPGVLSKHAELSSQDEAEFECGGGVAKETQNERNRNLFKAYIVSEINQSVEDLIRKEDKTEEEIKEDLAKLSKVFSKYFWTLRVDVMVRN